MHFLVVLSIRVVRISVISVLFCIVYLLNCVRVSTVLHPCVWRLLAIISNIKRRYRNQRRRTKKWWTSKCEKCLNLVLAVAIGQRDRCFRVQIQIENKQIVGCDCDSFCSVKFRFQKERAKKCKKIKIKNIFFLFSYNFFSISLFSNNSFFFFILMH